MACEENLEIKTNECGTAMNILYHLSILPPKILGGEAVTQDIAALQQNFGGQIIYINPNGQLPVPVIPRACFGFHKLAQLQDQERSPLLHHVFNPDPFPFPVLRYLRRPIIYSLTGGVSNQRINRRFFASLAAVTVSDERSLKKLQACGLSNVYVIPPGIDKSRFTHTPISLTSEIWLMVGSAPWSRAQFRSKGIDALLVAAQRCPELHLVFLWRGVLFDEMEARVRKFGIKRQVEVLNEQVDVNRVLARVHGSITLTTRPEIVRPYPYSLIESLAAGKPVLVSRCIPMADYVVRQGCGLVIENLTSEHLLDAVHQFSQKYDTLQNATSQIPPTVFSRQTMIVCWKRVYEAILHNAKHS